MLTNFAFLPPQHLNENLAKLTAKFEKATAEKLKCQQEAEVTAGTISLANRLVSLSSNYISRVCQVPQKCDWMSSAQCSFDWSWEWGGGGGIKMCRDAGTM